MMMSVLSFAPSPAVTAPDWAHTYFLGIFILFFGAFGRLTISSRRHKVKKLKYYITLLCHGDTRRELVKHSLDTPCAFIYFLLSGLVHFDKLWLYWSMYCMLSSSQPLIRIFYLLILATHLKVVRLLVLSFLFKEESFSFVKGLWLLDLINRKIFCGYFLDLLCIWCSSVVIGKSLAS